MIPIQNIYHMLSYAFQVLKEQGYKNLATEKFDNVADLAAAILAKGVSLQIKRGLGREYIIQQDSLSTLRGRIEISESIKDLTIRKKRLICSYDDFSVDSYMNRIIKTTMLLLLRSDIKGLRKKNLRKVLVFLGEVGTLDIHEINWAIQYDRNNQTYKMLHFVCFLVVKGLLQTNNNGSVQMMDFLDEQRMCLLYERFIFEYYRTEFPEIKTEKSQIPWALDDGIKDMLPVMETDITLLYRNKILIIDAKYYSHLTVERYGKRKLHSPNLYQIFAYVKNKTLQVGNGYTVSGMLLYAQTDEKIHPNQDYRMSGNKIFVRTLNLNCDFAEISGQLNLIAEKLTVRKNALQR